MLDFRLESLVREAVMRHGSGIGEEVDLQVEYGGGHVGCTTYSNN